MTTTWRKAKANTGHVTGQVDPWIESVLKACSEKALKSNEMQAISGIKHRETFQRNYLDHLLKEALIERTIPDKPKSRLQKYRLSSKRMDLLQEEHYKNKR